MQKKSLYFVGLVILLFVFNSCSSHPEENLLKGYFHALSMNDNTTLSTMALEPAFIDADHWKITEVGEEEIKPATLPDLNQKELDLKKRVEASVGTTLDARDKLDNAKFELESARTSAARRAARRKVDAEQVIYDEVYATHKELQKEYNDAKTAAAREEEVSLFSLGAGEIPNIRSLTGNVHTKNVSIDITDKAGVKSKYQLDLMMYVLDDEAMGITRRGRWIIVKFEQF